MSKHFQGPFGPLTLTFCGPSPNCEGSHPEGLPYFDPCVYMRETTKSLFIPHVDLTKFADQPQRKVFLRKGNIKYNISADLNENKMCALNGGGRLSIVVLVLLVLLVRSNTLSSRLSGLVDNEFCLYQELS